MGMSIIIVGTGGHAHAVTEVACSAGFTITGYLDSTSNKHEFLGAPVIVSWREIPPKQAFAIAIGHNFDRQRVHNDLLSEFPEARFPAIIHSSCVIGLGTEVGDGTIAMPNSYVGPTSKIGRFCIVNSSSSVDHECHLRDYSSVAPGATLGGNVSLGERAAVCIGASIKHGTTIGTDVVIGGNSFVCDDLPDGVVAYGCPATVRRQREFDSPYL